MREVYNFGSIAGEVTDCGIDLAKRDLHTFSVKPLCPGCTGGRGGFAPRLQGSGRACYNNDFAGSWRSADAPARANIEKRASLFPFLVAHPFTRPARHGA